MKIKLLLKLFLCAQSLAIFSSAFAFNSPVPCPPMQFVLSHLKYVNAIQIVKNNDYAVYTSAQFYDAGSHLKWQVGTEVYAADFNTAYEKGKKNIGDTVTQTDEFAEYLIDFWLCLYADENTTPVYLVSSINPTADIMEKVLHTLAS